MMGCYGAKGRQISAFMSAILLFTVHDASRGDAQPSSDVTESSEKANSASPQGLPKVRKNQGERPLPSAREQADALVVELRLELEKTPNDTGLLLKLSQTLLQLGSYQEALTHLRQVVSLSPNLPKARYLTAFTLRRLKRYREAIEEYEAFLDHAEGTDRLSGVFGLAKTLDLVGDPKGAIELYQTFLDEEKRPSQQRWIKEATESLLRLRSSEVALIDTDINEGEEPSEKKGELVSSQSNSMAASDLLVSADQSFAARDYAEAFKRYKELSERKLPQHTHLKMIYSAAVSAYLSGSFEEAKYLAEQGLLIDIEAPQLRGLAVLSHIQAKRQGSSNNKDFSSILPKLRLALREGRFQDALRGVDAYLFNQTTSVESGEGLALNSKAESKIKTQQIKPTHSATKQATEIDPIALHLRGRALLGLERYQEAYRVLKLATRGLNYPHLNLDLAQAALGMNKPKHAAEHYRNLSAQTAPREGEPPSPLYVSAQKALEKL